VPNRRDTLKVRDPSGARADAVEFYQCGMPTADFPERQLMADCVDRERPLSGASSLITAWGSAIGAS